MRGEHKRTGCTCPKLFLVEDLDRGQREIDRVTRKVLKKQALS